MLKSSATLLTRLKMKRLAVKSLYRLLKNKVDRPLRNTFERIMEHSPAYGFNPGLLSPVGVRDSFGDNVRIGDTSMLMRDVKEEG